MAGDWIKMRTDLATSPKVVRLSSALKADRFRVVGGLHSAWSLFDAHSADGQLIGYTPSVLDELIGWPGFADAMIAIQWLEFDGENLILPRFEDHNGASAKRRAQDKNRKNVARKSGNLSAPEADEKRTREEKRREEKEEDPAPADADAPPADPKPKRPKRAEVTLTAFSEQCREAGQEVIPGDDPVFTYAETVGLPTEYVALAWAWFKGRYGSGGDSAGKRYADWRAAFRNAVKGNWPKYWAVAPTGEVYLTATGKLAQREAQA